MARITGAPRVHRPPADIPGIGRFAARAEPIGGTMTKGAETPDPHWLFYFNVAEIEAATGRVRRHGDRVLNGPHDVPGGARVLQASDPQSGLALSTPAG